MEGGRRKEREKEGENHPDYKNDRKKSSGTAEMFRPTYSFFLAHIQQIHNGIFYMLETVLNYETQRWKSTVQALILALKDKRSRSGQIQS